MQIVPKTKLEAEDVSELAEELLHKQLSSFQTEGYKITTCIGLNVLMKAAVENRSIGPSRTFSAFYNVLSQS
jgi:hypothetical protein